MITKMPYTDYTSHGPSSSLVYFMNSLIQNGQFESYYKSKDMSKTYYLLRVVIHYPVEAQEKMKWFVPTLRKRNVYLEDLSPFQREMIERLGIHFDDKNKINIGDFNDQELSLSLEYCLTLCKIGVQILRVNHVEEAYAFPIFRKVIQNLLQLKAKEKMTFRKSLFKLLTNSSYGYLLLRLDSRLKVQLIHGFSSMRRAIDSPRLDHFQLLDKDRMIGYFVPEKVKYSTLLPLGMFYFVLFIFNNIFL